MRTISKENNILRAKPFYRVHFIYLPPKNNLLQFFFRENRFGYVRLPISINQLFLSCKCLNWNYLKKLKSASNEADLLYLSKLLKNIYILEIRKMVKILLKFFQSNFFESEKVELNFSTKLEIPLLVKLRKTTREIHVYVTVIAYLNTNTHAKFRKSV